MAMLIPENALRLQTTALITNAELSAIGRSEIIREAAKQMAESALQRILTYCIKTERGYQEFQGHTLRLDVYVLTPEEAHSMIAKAYERGAEDARRY